MAQWLAHWPEESGVVSSNPTWITFSQNPIIIFLFSWSFLFIFLNFEVKQCANMHWKYDNTGFAFKKKPNFFFIFQNGKYPTQGKNKTHCVVIKLSIQGTKPLSRWRWPCTWWQILCKREKERVVLLATFWKNDNSSCFWYTNTVKHGYYEFQGTSCFISL